MSDFTKKFEVITLLVASDDFGASVNGDYISSALDAVITAVKEGEGYGDYILLDHKNPVEKLLIDKGEKE
tara:strand:- start:52 stop:261 length:210 start_codon:yes stop_codon:yes gene_type:complete